MAITHTPTIAAATLARSNRRVETNMRVAESLAWRFAAPGGDVEDLRQVAYMGLVKASRRFDPRKGEDFLSFAVPTITGELKRHLRDHGYFVRPPRRIQELRIQIMAAREHLTHALRREPSSTDMARHLQISPRAVREALGSTARPAPLDVAERHLVDDAAPIERFDLLSSLAPAVRGLPARERHILYLRFFKELTQAQIARTVGVTQVHVSRLIAATLSQLRDNLGTDSSGVAYETGEDR